MRKDDKILLFIGSIGALIFVANALFTQYEWWPNWFKEIHTVTQGTQAALVLTIGAYLMWAQMGEMRSRSPQLTAENHRWSWNPVADKGIPAGEYFGFRAGGIQAMGFSMSGRDGTVFVHKDAYRSYGVNAILLSLTDPSPLAELPDAVRKAIKKYELPGPYYFGWAPSFVSARSRDFSRQSREIAMANREMEVNETSKVRSLIGMDQKNRMLTTQLSDQGKPRVVKAFNGIKRAFSNDDDSGNRDNDMQE